jgi:hypothetical protein
MERFGKHLISKIYLTNCPNIFGQKKMRASVGVNLWLGTKSHCPGLCVVACNAQIAKLLRHKGRAEAYFLLDFLFLFYQEKRKVHDNDGLRQNIFYQ